MKREVVYSGIIITATDEFGSLEVFFSNAPRSFKLGPSDDIPPLKGLKSLEEAINAGKKFVDEYQWQFVDTIGISAIYVRKWWDDKWGYSVRPGGQIETNYAGFKSREEAIQAARNLAIENAAETEEKIVEIDMGRGMRLIFA